MKNEALWCLGTKHRLRERGSGNVDDLNVLNQRGRLHLTADFYTGSIGKMYVEQDDRGAV